MAIETESRSTPYNRLRLMEAAQEARFDRLTRMAQRTFGVPVAAISLVDGDLIRFKSAIGLEVEQVDRSRSFCSHTFASDDLLVVPDATKDPRYATLPYVAGGPRYRFYAGYPVRWMGSCIGALCLLDVQPRDFTEEDREAIADLAALVQEELDRTRPGGAVPLDPRFMHALYEALDHLDIGLVIKKGSQTVFANEAVQRMLGYSDAEFRSLPTLTQLLDPAGQSALAARVPDWDSPDLPRDLVLEGSVTRRDGSDLHMEVSIHRLYFGDDRLIYVFTRDISARKQLEEARDATLATVSHEMRTPLTSLQFALGLMEAGQIQPGAIRWASLLDVAKRNSEHLVRLVNDILDAERLDSGKVQIEATRCELTWLFQRVIESFASQAETAGIRLEVHTPALVVAADADRLLQVLSNLLSNALKFSPHGSTIRLEAHRERDSLHITVRDEGRGIPADKLETIFERFQQIQANDFHQKKGVGLGLSICRAIVRQHGGRIWAESAPGAGSTFHVTLPLAGPEGA